MIEGKIKKGYAKNIEPNFFIQIEKQIEKDNVLKYLTRKEGLLSKISFGSKAKGAIMKSKA